jgi:hypothetical protein
MLDTASDTTRTAPGRRWRPSRLRTGAGEVGRWAHAYLEGQTTTLCAMPLDLLRWRELVHLDFAEVPERDRCELCALLADRW